MRKDVKSNWDVPNTKKKGREIPRKRTLFLKRDTLFDGLAIAFLCSIALLLYVPTLNYPFHFDDYHNIVENPYIKNIKNFSLFLEGLRIHGNWFRALPTLTFALNYHVHQLDVLGYHLINLILHMGSGILVYFISKHLFALAFRQERAHFSDDRIGLFTDDKRSLLSFYSAALFIVHPIQVNTVTYIVQRNEGMASFFYLLGFFFFIKGSFSKGFSRGLYISGAGVFSLFAILSKEIGFTLPLAMVLFDLLFVCENRQMIKKRLKIYLGLGFLLSIYILFFLRGGILHILFRQTHFWTPWENLITQAKVIIQYIKLMFFPWPGWLNIDHDFPISTSLFKFPTLLSLSAILFIFFLAIYLMKRRRLISFAIAWFFIVLAPTSSLIPIWDVMVEYRLYLPMFSYGLILTFLFHGLYRFLIHRFPEKIGRGIVIGVMFSLLCVYSIFTIQRNYVFKDGIKLWEDAMRKSPHKTRVYLNLGVMLHKAHRLEEAREMMEVALSKNPKNHPLVYYNLGLVYADLGRYEEALSNLTRYLKNNLWDGRTYYEIGSVYLRMGALEEAHSYFRKALEINPQFTPVHASLGDLYSKKGRIQEAIVEYRKAIQLDPHLAYAYIRLGEAYLKEGNEETALIEMKKAIVIDPNLPDAYASLGSLSLQRGNFEEAFLYLKKALELDPKSPDVYNNLGVLYRERGQLDEAIVHYWKAIELDPNLFDAHVNLGEAYGMKKMVGEALLAYQKAISIHPDRAEIYNNIGVIYLQEKRIEEAILNFKKALRLNQNYGEACFNLAVAYYYKKDLRMALHYSQQALNLGYRVDPNFLGLLKSPRYK